MSSSQWVEYIKTDKIWLCESVCKLKGIGNQGEVKINEINIHTIYYLQRYVISYGLKKLPIRGLGQIYEHVLVDLPGKPMPSIKDHRKAKNSNFSRYGERWVEKLKSSSSMSKWKALVSRVDLPVHVHKFGLSHELATWATHMIDRTFGNQRWYER